MFLIERLGQAQQTRLYHEQNDDRLILSTARSDADGKKD